MYYRPEGKAVCADVIPYYENGTFYLFYLRDYRDYEAHGEGCPWCLLTTQDLVRYEDHGEVLPRGDVSEQDLYVFTGSCIKANGSYYIFYTGHNPHKRQAGYPEQKILLARSSDLYHWEKLKDFEFEAPDYLEMHDFRDPFVFFDEEKKKYAMLLAARLKNDAPVQSRGVTMIAYSDDLLHWDLEKKPFLTPGAYFTHECPDLFKMGDWWYLVFSEFTDKVVTTYRMAKSPNGPWITPKVNTFDGHAFYAAKSASDGQHRYMFGWNCIKDREEDNNNWQWGGNIIPHELVQNEDGTLYVKCPDAVRKAYSEKCALSEGFRLNTVEKSGETFTVGTASDQSIQLFNRMPENCKIEMTFETTDEVGDFGVLLRAGNVPDTFYKIRFEPRMNRLAPDKWARRIGEWHVGVDCERYCPIEVGKKHRLVIIVEGSVAEIYVDDRVAMSTRMFDLKEGSFGIYTHNTTVRFSDIGLFVPGK